MPRWYTNKDGSPKTNRRPRICEICRDNPTVWGSLPLRAPRKVRWLKALENNPNFFKGSWFRRFALANFNVTGAEPTGGASLSMRQLGTRSDYG